MLFKKEWLHKIPKMLETEDTELEDKEFKLVYYADNIKAKWQIVEAEKEGDDILFFGYIEGFGFADEWGEFTLSQLEEINEAYKSSGLSLKVKKNF
ncbi:hypothetical protein [Alkalibacterium sp. 20]|uniref:hypothetical protein n=1 Tax=Alkalibacterium sp. 20 TaxID=1798803 RepID=UPI0009003B38|nr:hypothetical protein [Alkalibacterium sp. 20]OJF96166.1 hypothetical protein AX762_05385 [Alkalibacterium sp. 20]